MNRSWETPGIAGISGHLDVLHMTHLWRMRAGFDFAVSELHKLNLKSSHRIYLALRYGIPQWVPMATRVLLRLSFDDLNAEDLNHLGYNVFEKIAKGKESVLQIRRSLAFYPPYPKVDDAPHCTHQERCKKTWFEVWGKEIFRLIHHPSNYLPLSSILITLKSVKHDGMHKTCKSFVISWMEESCPGLQKEERAICQTVSSIQDMARIHMLVD